MPGLVPGIHVSTVAQQGRRGWTGLRRAEGILSTVTPSYDGERIDACGHQRSSVNTGDLDREQQTMILPFSAFSSSLRKLSR